MMEEELTDIELDVVRSFTLMNNSNAQLNIDTEKIRYNERYRCFDFFAKKFPPGWDSIPGFDRVITLCQTNGSKMTPLQEMELRQVVNEDIEVGISER